MKLKAAQQQTIAWLQPYLPRTKRDYLQYGLVVVLIAAALFFVLRPADRYVFKGDGERSEGCTFNATLEKAPSTQALTVTTYYLFNLSEPIPANDTSRTWGDCPYSKQKLETYALDLWLLAGAVAFSGRLRKLYRQV